MGTVMFRIIISITTLSLLTACAAPVVKDSLLIQQTASEQAQESNQDVTQVLNEVRDLQISAQREDLYFYSPTYILQADEQLAKADKAIESTASSKIVLTHILAAKQLLNRGLDNKQTVIVQLKPALDGLEMLTQINTPTLLSKDFKNVQDDTKDLIVLIEQGKNSQAEKDLEDVLSDIRKLEIKTLKKSFLLPAEKALETAEEADAEDYAPKSFVAAKQAIEQFEIFIEKNPTKRDEISKQSTQSIHLAQHAHHVAKDAKPLLKLNHEQAEQHILSFEKMLGRMGTALNHPNISHLPLDSQSIALAQAAEIINKQAQALKNQGQWETEKQLLEQQIENLKKSQALQNSSKQHNTKTEQVDSIIDENIAKPLQQAPLSTTNTEILVNPVEAQASDIPDTTTSTEITSPQNTMTKEFADPAENPHSASEGTSKDLPTSDLPNEVDSAVELAPKAP